MNDLARDMLKNIKNGSYPFVLETEIFQNNRILWNKLV